MKWFKSPAQKQAELRFNLMLRASEVFTECANDPNNTEGYVILVDEKDDNGTMDIYANDVHSMYKLFETMTANECDWSDDLSQQISKYISDMVSHLKHITMTDVMSKPIVVVCHKDTSPVIVPQQLRMVKLANGQYKMGELVN